MMPLFERIDSLCWHKKGARKRIGLPFRVFAWLVIGSSSVICSLHQRWHFS